MFSGIFCTKCDWNVLRNVQVIGEKLLYNLPKSATAPALIFINLMLAQQLFVKEKKKWLHHWYQVTDGQAYVVSTQGVLLVNGGGGEGEEHLDITSMQNVCIWDKLFANGHYVHAKNVRARQ